MTGYGRSGGNAREGGSFDVVTIMRQQETNPAWQRMAHIDGWDTLLTGNPTHCPDADVEANWMSSSAMMNEDLKQERALSDALLATMSKDREGALRAEYHQDCVFLAQNYERHPEIPAQMRERIFVYHQDADAGIEGYDLDVSATVAYSSGDMNDKGKLEALLAAEKEMGKNPQVLRELSEMTKFRGSYIVKFPSTQSAKDEPQKQVQVPVSGQSFERENNGRKPRTLSV